MVAHTSDRTNLQAKQEINPDAVEDTECRQTNAVGLANVDGLDAASEVKDVDAAKHKYLVTAKDILRALP
eukprot:1824143-Amphidinium_carterae.1